MSPHLIKSKNGFRRESFKVCNLGHKQHRKEYHIIGLSVRCVFSCNGVCLSVCILSRYAACKPTLCAA